VSTAAEAGGSQRYRALVLAGSGWTTAFPLLTRSGKLASGLAGRLGLG
jgi:hypothetical protein